MEIAQDRNNVSKYGIVGYYHTQYKDISGLRIGSYRAIFKILRAEILIVVFKLIHGELFINEDS